MAIPPLRCASSNQKSYSEIIIPNFEKASLDQTVTGIENAKNKDVWEKFISDNGNWNVLISRSTGTPVAAFGKGIQIEGFYNITKENIKDAAAKFIFSNENILGSSLEQLHFISSRSRNNHWYVSYYQTVHGSRIIDSRLELRIFRNGKVSAFFSKLYPDAEFKPGRLTPDDAKLISTYGLNLIQSDYDIACDSNRYVFPLENSGSLIYKPVYKITINVYGADKKRYLVYVDADDGVILRRVNLVNDLESTGNLKGYIKMHNALEKDTIADFSQCYLDNGSKNILTDNNGNFSKNLSGNTSFYFNFKSIYANELSREGKSQSKPLFQILDGTENPLLLSDDNSHLIERTTFYHINKIHEFYKKLDPTVDVPNQNTCLILYWNFEEDNAYSDFDTIVFWNMYSSKMSLGLTPDVIYHEYGHSYVNLLYKELSGGEITGLYNATIHEGLADLSAALAGGSPNMGIGAFNGYPDSCFRKLNNKIRYPEGIHGESHYDGQIISGAYWDLLLMTSHDFVNRLVQDVKYGMPDDMNVGLAFYKFFIETMVADDDDGDLDNGTPHAEQIIEAFDNHGIGLEILAKINFKHLQTAKNINEGESYKINFSLNMSKLQLYDFKNVSVAYSTDNFVNTLAVPATRLDGYNYETQLPIQNDGSIIKYYISAVHPLTGKIIKFTQGVEDTTNFFYSVNFENVYNLSSDHSNWKIGAQDDEAESGKWIWEIPNRVSSYGALLQPDGNSKGEHNPCFITGNCIDSISYYLDFPDGTTTIISPTISLSPLKEHYAYFSSYYSEFSLPYQDNHYKIYISTDEGTSWEEIADLMKYYFKWHETMVPLNQYLGSSGKIKFKVVLEKGEYLIPGFPCALMSKGIFDDFNIMSSKTNLSVKEKNQNDINISPNPFDKAISFKLTGLMIKDLISAEIVDISGNTIVSLPKQYSNEIQWNGKNSSGEVQPSGTYFLKLTYKNEIKSYKLMKE